MILSSLPAHVVGDKTLISHGSTNRGQVNMAESSQSERLVDRAGHWVPGWILPLAVGLESLGQGSHPVLRGMTSNSSIVRLSSLGTM